MSYVEDPELRLEAAVAAGRIGMRVISADPDKVKDSMNRLIQLFSEEEVKGLAGKVLSLDATVKTGGRQSTRAATGRGNDNRGRRSSGGRRR